MSSILELTRSTRQEFYCMSFFSVHVDACIMMHMGRSEDNSVGTILSLQLSVGSSNLAQSARLAWQAPLPTAPASSHWPTCDLYRRITTSPQPRMPAFLVTASPMAPTAVPATWIPDSVPANLVSSADSATAAITLLLRSPHSAVKVVP